MRVPTLLASAVLALATLGTGAALAGEALYLTPPLFREQARETQQVHRSGELTTIPQPVAATKPSVASRAVQIVADAETTASR
jgi:hypothetical protein